MFQLKCEGVSLFFNTMFLSRVFPFSIRLSDVFVEQESKFSKMVRYS